MAEKFFKYYNILRKSSDIKFLITEEGGNLYFNNEPLVDPEGKPIAEGDTFVNVGFNRNGSIAKVLSNLFPLEFDFKGQRVASIEAVLQGIKYKEYGLQKEILKYSGLQAYSLRDLDRYEWQKEGTLYWLGKPIDRFSEEYQTFLDELFCSAFKNPIYRKALQASGDKALIHSMGESNPQKTVLTRQEYETRLNTLRYYAFVLKGELPTNLSGQEDKEKGC